jgi:hypothetical protein
MASSALASVDQGVTLGMNNETGTHVVASARGAVEYGEVGELEDSTKGVGHELLAVLREAQDVE